MNTISKYTYMFHSEKHGYLIYNSVSNFFAEISNELFINLNKIKEDPLLLETALTSEEKEIFLKYKIITEQSKDDNYRLIQKMHYYMNVFNQDTLSLTIAPTMDCNFDCVYCFEYNKPPIYMKEETENKIIDFINLHRRSKDISVMWYGGEPLMGFKIIKSLFAKIKKIENKNVIDHRMVTNGYLLTKNKFDFFKEFPLNSVQITIDGLKDLHDSRRCHRNRNISTYDRIIENVSLFTDEFPNTQVVIRIHVEKNNQDQYAKVYSELHNLWKSKNVTFYPGFIVENQKTKPTNCLSLNKDELSEFYINLYNKEKINVNFYPQHRIGSCAATCINAYVIGPTGDLCKCWDEIGDPSKVIGNISSIEIQNKELLAEYIVGENMYDDEKCKDCLLLPICMGGCPLHRIKNKKEAASFNLCSARKDNLNKFLEYHYGKRKMQNSTTTPTLV